MTRARPSERSDEVCQEEFDEKGLSKGKKGKELRMISTKRRVETHE